VRKIRPQQLEDFEALLVNYDWSSVLNCTDTDEKVNNFLQVTENMISDYFQEKTVRIYSNDKPFMTHNIKRLIVRRNKAFKNKEIECIKSLRRKISSEIRKGKSGFTRT
jgi:NAD(P)H-flavin reductase